MVFFVNASNYFIQREKELLGDRFDALYAAADAPARGITVNTLRMEPDKLAQQAGMALRPSPFCKNSFLLEGDQKPGLHPYHHGGAIYVQEPSAASAAPLLEVEPGMKVADLCAAPGGKTSQLAAALGGQGLLLANEYDSRRAQILKSNLERMGVANAVITNEDTGRLAAAFPGFFDRVLVDAPCSGEGMFRKEPQAVDQHCEGLVRHCAQLTAEILDNAAAMVAPGGMLVLSTCTFSPEEDEGQAAAFLARHPEFSLLDCPGDFGAPGEENRCGGLPLDVSKVRRIWPCQGGEGHFMARMQKAGQRPEATGSAPSRKKAGRPPKPCPEWESFCKSLFPNLPATGPAVLAGDTVWLLPAVELPPHKLRVLRSGVMAGTVQKGRFVPAHQLFMVFGALCANREELTLADPRTAAWLRGEEIQAQTAQNGWCAVLVDGVPVGFGKKSGEKIKNHYPKALRNLK